jgi:Tol biopolymer transport system component
VTTFDRFDPFERRIGEALDGIAPQRRPDYLDDLLQRTARSSQRPRWSFPERWLPVDTTLSRPTNLGRFPARQLAILAVIVALVAAALAFYVGSQHRLPPPFGLAANGALAYVQNGDVYVRDQLTGTGRLLFGGGGEQHVPSYAPDGTRLSYVSTIGTVDHFMSANADGTKSIELAQIPATGNAQAAWSPDSTRIAFVYDVKGVPTLSVVSAVDGAARTIDLGGLRPWDVAWQPTAGERLLIRAVNSYGYMDIYTLKPDGSDLRPFHMPNGLTPFGSGYTLSGLVWSPDGSTVAYNSVEVQEIPQGTGTLRVTHFRLHLINADGTGDRAVPAPESPFVQEGWPSYSPDGKWLIVHRWVFKSDAADVDGGVAQGWIAIMPADGSAPARDIGPKIDGGEDTGIEKLWSPDGTSVLISVGNTHQVFSIDPTTGAYEQLPWSDVLPSWQRVAS